MSDIVLNVIAQDAEALADALRVHGPIDWLAPGHAFDVAISGDPAPVLAHARALAHTADVNLVHTRSRRKKLLVADMDSTIIGCECLDEIADMAGLKPQVAAITERAMRGEIDFAPALRERVNVLKGLPLVALDIVYRERVRLNPGARALVTTMRKNGARTLLVSGGFSHFTKRVAADAGFHAERSNVLLHDGLYLLGRVREPILGREAKLQALEEETAAAGIEPAETLAVGDGANDLDMIRRAGLGVAYHAKPLVADAAGARIAHGDLTALLYLQGYRQDEIVAA